LILLGSHERRLRDRGTVCLLISALSLVGLFATYLIAVRTARGQALDLTALRGSSIQVRPVFRVARGVLGTISVASLIVVFSVLCGVALVRRQRKLALVVGVMVLGAVGTTELLKRVILPRPLLARLTDGEAPVNTLPSGHSTIALIFVVAIVLVVPRKWQGIVSLVGGPAAVAVGISTVLQHWHRPSDVVAAWFVVAAFAFAALIVLDWLDALPTSDSASWERHVTPVLLAAVIGTVVALTAATLVGFGVHVRRGLIDYASFRSAAAFGFSAAAITALGFTVIASVLWVLHQPNH
jgi:membrane-associated phospholipid phosphatase